jgi:hypothetical protein
MEVQAAHERIATMLSSLSDVVETRWAEIGNMTYAQKRDVLAELGVKVTVFPPDAPQRWIIDMNFDLDEWIRRDEELAEAVYAGKLPEPPLGTLATGATAIVGASPLALTPSTGTEWHHSAMAPRL